MMVGWIEHHASMGHEVDFGPLGQTRVRMSSVFAPSDELVWPDEWRLTIGWQVARRLQLWVDPAAKKTGLGRRPAPNRGPNVVQVTDLMTRTRDAYTLGGLLGLRGSRLKFDQAQPDEGVFFTPAVGRRPGGAGRSLPGGVSRDDPGCGPGHADRPAASHRPPPPPPDAARADAVHLWHGAVAGVGAWRVIRGRGELYRLGPWQRSSLDGTIAEHLRGCWPVERHGECDDWGVDGPWFA